MSSPKKHFAIIGGGASGFFAALRAAKLIQEEKRSDEVHLYESAGEFLRKLKISGGGRCNVTHHQFNPKEFCKNYPRGERELLSPFTQFQATDTVEWFKERGVTLVAEDDGRMFPSTNLSETIINCFLEEAEKVCLHLHRGKSLQTITHENNQFTLDFGNEVVMAEGVIMATGSSPKGYALAKSLGHTITDLAPSLFSFKIEDQILNDGAGTSFPNARLTLKSSSGKKFEQQGPILITHWGLSGPALLKLSAWAARELKDDNYKGRLLVNWLGLLKESDVFELLLYLKREHNKSFIQNGWPEGLTKKFWGEMLTKSGVEPTKKWCDLSKDNHNKLTQNLFAMPLEVLGQNRFKDEFVECGGVSLKEINFKTMESKFIKKLYFTGELLDIDGITGGFNFQNAWTTGFIAGSNIIED